jgi:hypothetical protein
MFYSAVEKPSSTPAFYSCTVKGGKESIYCPTEVLSIVRAALPMLLQWVLIKEEEEQAN